jgi:hypothetical protein
MDTRIFDLDFTNHYSKKYGRKKTASELAVLRDTKKRND